MRRLMLLICVLVSFLVAGSVFAENIDFDKDGFGDLFLDRPTGIYWYESDGGDNTVQSSPVNTITGGGGELSTAVSVGYLDNDDNMDLAVGRDDGNGDNLWFENDGDNSVSRVGSGRIINGWAMDNQLVIGDFDGDGTGGVFTVKSFGSNESEIFESTGDNAAAIDHDGVTWNVSCAGQVGMNHQNGIFIGRNNSSNVDFYLPKNDNSGIEYKNSLVLPDSKKAVDVVANDFDGDELMDVFVAADSGDLFQYEFSDTSFWSSPFVDLKQTIAGIDAQCVDIGDIDGDGIKELAVGTASGLSWYEADGSGLAYSTTGYNAGGVSIKDVAIAEVPEPATIAILGLGTVGLIRRRYP